MGLSKCIRLNLVKNFLLNQVTLDAVHPLHLKVTLCGKCLGKDAFWVLMSKPFSKNVTFHKTVISNPPQRKNIWKYLSPPHFLDIFHPTHPWMVEISLLWGMDGGTQLNYLCMWLHILTKKIDISICHNSLL